MKKFSLWALLLMFSIIGLQSCKEDSVEREDVSIKSSREIMKKAILELTEIQQRVTENDYDSFMEIYYLSKNDYYKDNYVFLSDLLNPNNSDIYQKCKIPKEYVGKYKQEFYQVFNKKEYPNLSDVINRNTKNLKNINSNNFYDLAKISFYIPYLLNDNNTELQVSNITYVSGIKDADEAKGVKFVGGKWETVLADDDYSSENLTTIIEPNTQLSLRMMMGGGLDGGSGGGSGSGTPPPNSYTGDCDNLIGTNATYIRQVFIGHARLNHQYDHYISFTGNGGGSEIRIGRVSAEDHIPIDTNTSGTHVNVNDFDNYFERYFSRRDIRKGNTVWIGSLWDRNWKCNDVASENLIAIWESDNTESEVTFNNLNLTVWDQQIISVDGSISVKTNDDIIKKQTIGVDEFFATNLYDQGCGCHNGNYSYSDRCWAWYDCGTNFKFTMPHRWYYIP